MVAYVARYALELGLNIIQVRLGTKVLGVSKEKCTINGKRMCLDYLEPSEDIKKIEKYIYCFDSYTDFETTGMNYIGSVTIKDKSFHVFENDMKIEV